MNTVMMVIQWSVRLLGLVMIALGLLFWVGVARSLLPVHMLLGLLVVLLLWAQSGLAARAGVARGLVALAVVWGLITPVLGMTQAQLLPGAAHWVIQVLHLAVGLVALALAERLAVRGRAALADAPTDAVASQRVRATREEV